MAGEEHEKVGCEPEPAGIGTHLEENRGTPGLARESPQQVDEAAFKALFRQAVALNSSRKPKPSKKTKS